MSLVMQEIEARRSETHTDSYPMSIGEVLSLYRDSELDIHPEFQRFFRWDLMQKTRLIESILLGIPIPSIFVSQRSDGVWDVIDGLQRLSTILEFVGELKDEKGKKVTPLVLAGTKLVPSLQGIKWAGEGEPALPDSVKRDFKRSKLSFTIVLKQSAQTSKYELFQRLNTGGSPLSDQEVRNCILIMENKSLYEWVLKLSKDPNFVECTSLSDKALVEQYNLELVIRFLALCKRPDLSRLHNLGEFLTEFMVEIARQKKFPRTTHERTFKRTFKTLKDTLGPHCFRRYDYKKKKRTGGFLISGFEVLACGVGYHMGTVPPRKLKRVANELWKNKKFQKGSGSGVGAGVRIPVTVPLGRDLLG